MRDDQIDALLESLDDIAMRFDPYKSSQALDSQLREAVRSAIARAQLAAAPVAAQGERQPDTIKGICDFCSNESDALAEVPGSRTMAGFVICPKCASEKNER